MRLFKRSEKKADVALGGAKITLQLVKELADLIPMDCVGPIIGAALTIMEAVEVSNTRGLHSLFHSFFLHQGAKTNTGDCRDLQDRLGNLMIVVLTPLQGKTEADLDPDFKRSLDRLSGCVD